MAVLLRRGLDEEGYVVDVAADGPEGPVAGAEEQVRRDRPGRDAPRPRRVRSVPAATWLGAVGVGPAADCADSVDDRLRGLDAGTDDYLVKLFAFEEFAARVRALLRRGASARPAVLAVGDLMLDPAARTGSRAGAQVELTAKEFAVPGSGDESFPGDRRLRTGVRSDPYSR